MKTNLKGILFLFSGLNLVFLGYSIKDFSLLKEFPSQLYLYKIVFLKWSLAGGGVFLTFLGAYHLFLLKKTRINYFRSFYARHKLRLLLILALISGALVRFNHLGGPSLWLDELLGYSLFSQPCSFIFFCSWRIDDTTFLTHLLFKASLLLFGKSEVSLRLFPALFGIASLFMLYKLGSLLFSREIGVLASLFMSINIFNIYHSQNARVYQILVFFTLLNVYFYIKMVRDSGGFKSSLGYILTSISGLYLHYIFFVFLLVEWLHFGFVYFRKNFKKVVSTVGVILGASFVQIIIILEKSVRWKVQASGWLKKPGLYDIYSLFRDFSLSFYEHTFSRGIIHYIFFFLFLLGVIKAIGMLRKKEYFKETSFLLFWVFLSIFIVFLFSRLSPNSYFHSRYLIFLSPAYLLIASLGSIYLFRKIGFEAVYFFILWFGLYHYPFYYYYYTRGLENWREAIRYVQEREKEGDFLLVETANVGDFIVLAEKEKQDSLNFKKISDNFLKAPLIFYYQGKLASSYLLYSLDKEKFPRFYEELKKKLLLSRRIWLIDRFYWNDKSAEFVEELTDYKFRRVFKKEYNGLDLYLLNLTEI